MRYVEGTDLRRILQESAPLEPKRALALLAPVAGALDAAHAGGLVHRDVKPGNILVAVDADADPPEHVYLSDFGLSTLSAESDAGVFTGTADYAAPELVTGGPVGGRSDLYSLGCVLFECLTAEPPFRGDSVMSVLWGHVNDPVPRASERNPRLPEAIDHVFRKALAKEPAKRYASSRDLIVAARDALGVIGLEVPTLARRRWLGAVAVLAPAVVAAGLLLGVLLTRGSGSEQAADTGALVRIDPAANRAGDPIRVGSGPTTVAADGRDVWVSARRDASLWRIAPATGAVSRVAAVGVPGDLALYGGRAYVASEGPQAFTGNVTVYEAATGRRIGGVELLACSLSAGPEGVWVAGCPNLQQLSEGETLTIVRTVEIPYAQPRDTAHDRQELADMTSGAGAVFALGDFADRRLWRIDPTTGTIARTYRLSFAPAKVALGAGAIWIVDQLDDAVVRIDPDSGRVVGRISIGRGPSGLAFGQGSVWATSLLDRTVTRIDPQTNTVIATIRVEERPRDIAVGAGAVWVVGDAD